MATSIGQPFALFTDDDGRPLDGGYVYIGVAGLEPISNPQSVYWDGALTIPAGSTLRTKLGYLYRAGTPAQAYVASAYSITVKDTNGITIYTELNVSAGPLLGSMASQNEGTAGEEFRDNAANDARFLLRSEYNPTSSVGANHFKIMNGDFSVNQRAFTSVSSVPTIQQYTVDGWRCYAVNDTTPGQSCEWFANTGVIGSFVPARVLRIVSTGQLTAGSRQSIQQRVESARTYSGQTVTFFAWLKRATAGNVAVSIRQNFGTGGSPSADVTTHIGQVAITTSFAAYRFVGAIPSVSGKTFGTNNDDYLEVTFWSSAGSTFNAETGSLGLFDTTLDFYGIHDRPGDVPIDAMNSYQTPDQQAALAKCQRYFERMTDCMRVSSAAPIIGQATFAAQKRAVPTISGLTYSGGTGATFAASKTGITQNGAHSMNALVTNVDASAEL